VISVKPLTIRAGLVGQASV